MKLNYKVFGKAPIEFVIEIGLGACISEWEPFMRQVEPQLTRPCGILIYERAGIHLSEVSKAKRTPENIANELYDLLKEVPHAEKIVLLAHSQGGLYAQAFCRKYPDMVKGLILLDPLSAKDNLFKEMLSPKEYKQSGVDKSTNFYMIRALAKLHMGGISKKFMRKAPPFYYYNSFSKEETKEILGCLDKVTYADTVLNECIEAHEEKNIRWLKEKDQFPDIPLILITHASEPAVEESMLFGNNSREFATKIEKIWQEIMKGYLEFSEKSDWVQAKKSTHFIHLLEPEIVIEAIKKFI